jgi:putative hemolysin
MMHPKLRTALLPHELLNKGKKSIKVRIGNAIPFSRLTGFRDDEKLVTYLRMRTYALRHRSLDRADRRPPMESVDMPQGKTRVAAQGKSADMIIREVDHLPCDQLLAQGDGYAVFHARAHQIPNLLFEIGRLRETTFRQSGEGTGKPIDLDRFDLYYTHLFLWHSEKKEVVGAYRLGLVDLIHERFGRKGLYTSTLFDYKESFLGHVSRAIELGRSFVRPEYQKLYSPLLLLWKGIARFVAINPRYTTLFGPVTISNDYSALSKQLMVAYLTANHYAPDLARLIKPRTPLRGRSLRRLGIEDQAAIPADLDDLSSLVSDIEADRKGVPILLRQYVKLGGRLMGFNIDPSFGNGLDGLIRVDLLKCDRKILSRYMGKDGADGFFRYHEEGRENLACS